VTDDERTIEALSAALPQVAPPADLWARIAEEIHPPAEVRPFRPRVSWPVRFVAAAALAAAVVLAVVLIGRSGPSRAATARIVPHLAGGDVQGTASLYDATKPDGTVRLSLSAVPPPPKGHHYEVWVLGHGEKAMTAVGSFTPATREVKLRLPLPAPGAYDAVDISIQVNGGPAAHSSVSLAGGAFAPRSS
jgi:anti-sigma-K factor RskA